MKTLLLGKLLHWDSELKEWTPSYCNWNNLSVYPAWIKDTIHHLFVLVGYKYKNTYHTNCKSLINKCNHE